MVKTNRLVTLDPDLNEKLSGEENASGLISELLEKHYALEQSNDLEYLNARLEESQSIINRETEKLDSIKAQINKVSRDTEKNKEIVEEKQREEEKQDELKKYLMGLLKQKLIEFNFYMSFKKNPLLWEEVTKLKEEEITLEEFLETQRKYLEKQKV
jgi:hypothetical protein